MKVALFISCYVNELYPDVAMASLELLEGYGLEVEYPLAQTCCGQPLVNNGDLKGACQAEAHFADVFKGYDYIVAPSGSCVAHIKKHATQASKSDPNYVAVASKTYEIIEFLQEILKVTHLPKSVSFPHTVSIHQSCHGLRALHHATPSELQLPYHSRLASILALVDDIVVKTPERVDECCGFGGTFCMDEPAVSVAMGQDRVAQHQATGATYIVGADSSCLMHMGAIAKAQNAPVRARHIVEILTGRGE